MYPVMLDVRGRNVLVVGAGPVATQKARGLVSEGAQVTVVAPQVSDAMQQLAVHELITRTYESTDLADRWLVFAATGDEAVNQRIHDEATAHGIWVNCADEPARCSFILPAVHRDGPITVSVSTTGASPALAGWLRTRLANALPRNVDRIATELRAKRDEIKARGESTEGRDWTPLIEELVSKHGS